MAALLFSAASLPGQDTQQSSAPSTDNSQLKVNWLYGSYVPKDVPLLPLDAHMRFRLYIRATYTTWGIYVKSISFTLHDQIRGTYPEWGDGFDGFAKRLGTRQAEFIIQNSTIALGNGLVGWEPRYDRCRCPGFWPRTRHAMVRNFVTYNRTEESLRPQLMPYLGAFAGSVTSSAWVPGHPKWQVRGYQAAITQIPVGMGINWISEFAPEIFGVLKKHEPK
jgi:hypothetical protein